MLYNSRNRDVVAVARGILTVGWTLIASVASAQITPESADCALARDPVRCLARADAIATCANLHGTPKRDCLLTRLPAPDCKAAPNPARCQLEQDAKESCKSLQGTLLRNCLKDHGIEPPKKGKAKRKAAAKSKKKGATMQ